MNRFRTACTTPGEFIITAEVAPPKGGDITHTIQMAERLKNRVHAINITDGSRAVLGMCPLAVSAILVQHGIEPICQVACRDRNQIRLQADPWKPRFRHSQCISTYRRSRQSGRPS